MGRFPRAGRSDPRDRAINAISTETGTIPNRNVYKPESDRERVYVFTAQSPGTATSGRRRPIFRRIGFRPANAHVADVPHGGAFLLRPRAFMQSPHGRHKRARKEDSCFGRFVFRSPESCSGRYVFRTPRVGAVPVGPWLAPVDADRDRSDPHLSAIFSCARRLVRPRRSFALSFVSKDGPPCLRCCSTSGSRRV
jgi:hypothetical protein